MGRHLCAGLVILPEYWGPGDIRHITVQDRRHNPRNLSSATRWTKQAGSLGTFKFESVAKTPKAFGAGVQIHTAGPLYGLRRANP